MADGIIDSTAFQILAYLHRMPGSMTTSIYDYVFDGSKNTKQARLKLLLDEGLVTIRGDSDSPNKYNTKRYDLTNKGEAILDLLTEVHNMMEESGNCKK